MRQWGEREREREGRGDRIKRRGEGRGKRKRRRWENGNKDDGVGSSLQLGELEPGWRAIEPAKMS